MYREIQRCRICGNTELVEVLDLGMQALTGVFPRSLQQAVPVSPLQLVKCVGGETACGLVQLRHTYDLGAMYGDNYGYRSGLNRSMVEHLHGKVRRIQSQIDLPDGSLIIDIGSNDSTTLQAYPQSGLTLVGIDPTGRKFREYYPPHVDLIADFFAADSFRKHFPGRKARVISSFSMLYDLEDPLRFMRDIAEVLAEDGIWVFEQSYMPTMLERNSYDTVCHEHLEYYGLKQIVWMAQRAGLKIVDVEFNDVNGGSFSLTAAHAGSRSQATPAVAAALHHEQELQLDTLAPYQAFAQRVAASRDALLRFIATAKAEGKRVCALGASTKGNVLLQYCAIDRSQVEKVGEVNSDKFGSFTPGSLLPIVPERELLSENPDYLLVLPWHFRPYFMRSRQLAGRRLLFPLPELEVASP